MVVEADLAVRLRRLLAELRADLAGLTARADETREISLRWTKDGSLARTDLIVAAVNLHGWYTAAETAYERVARLLDQTVPEGASWHVEILAQMRVDVPGLRPEVLPAGAIADMQELRKFRQTGCRGSG